jgi:hypothetical protein
VFLGLDDMNSTTSSPLSGSWKVPRGSGHLQSGTPVISVSGVWVTVLWPGRPAASQGGRGWGRVSPQGIALPLIYLLSLQYSILSDALIFCQSVGCKIVSNCGPNLHFPDY